MMRENTAARCRPKFSIVAVSNERISRSHHVAGSCTAFPASRIGVFELCTVKIRPCIGLNVVDRGTHEYLWAGRAAEVRLVGICIVTRARVDRHAESIHLEPAGSPAGTAQATHLPTAGRSLQIVSHWG